MPLASIFFLAFSGKITVVITHRPAGRNTRAISRAPARVWPAVRSRAWVDSQEGAVCEGEVADVRAHHGGAAEDVRAHDAITRPRAHRMAVVGCDDARELGPASEHLREHAWAAAHVEDRRVGLV